jgi:hypothetical protein
MSPAVRLRYLYVTSGLDLKYFDRSIFVAQGLKCAERVQRQCES